MSLGWFLLWYGIIGILVTFVSGIIYGIYTKIKYKKNGDKLDQILESDREMFDYSEVKFKDIVSAWLLWPIVIIPVFVTIIANEKKQND